MTRLGELYTDFLRIDLDAPGGYARVAQVTRVGETNPKFVAFKLMRHEIDYRKGLERFERELRLLAAINQDKYAPTSITKLYGSGFAYIDLSLALHNNNVQDLEQVIIPTGEDIDNFLNTEDELQITEPNRWLPYIVVELAPYDDCLLRQINRHTSKYYSEPSCLNPAGVVSMAIQLLDAMEYIHTMHRCAYIDWKPEHIFWDGIKKQAKLIDWNVTTMLVDNPGKKQNVRDDIRLFCGAALYCSLALTDPDDLDKSIGPKPQADENLVPLTRRQYWTDKPNFYQRDAELDSAIKHIVQRGLDPRKGFDSPHELKTTLLNYAQIELGLSKTDILAGSNNQSDKITSTQTKDAKIESSSTLIFHSEQVEHEKQLNVARTLLSSSRLGDIWRSMEIVREWLQNNPEDLEVYGLLIDSVAENPGLREQVRSLLIEMQRRGSKAAESALQNLPATIQDLLNEADGAYYATQYNDAINLYRQVLKIEPENERAKDHIAKAEIKRLTGEADSELPRAAVQYYRRARSYIAARDIPTAINLLSAAIEAAQAKGMKYPDAEEALSNMENLFLADNFREEAKKALDKNQWQEALEIYNKALMLDTTNVVMKKDLDALQELIRIEQIFRKRQGLPNIFNLFKPIGHLQNTVDTAKEFINPGNSLLVFAEKKLRNIKLIRAVGIFTFLFAFSLLVNVVAQKFFTIPIVSNTPVITQPTNISTLTQTIKPANTKTEEPQLITATNTYIATNTPTSKPTETLTPTSTIAILGIGYINKGSVSAWDAPNGMLLIERLGLNEPLTILEKREATGFTWYRCQWDSNGMKRDGWILADYITLGPPPTPRQ